MARGLGDLPYKDMDPLEAYWDIVHQGGRLPRRRWIVKPEFVPPPIPGMEAWQKFLEEHKLPRAWQLLADFWLLLQKGQFFVKNPLWIEPPVTAESLDLRNETVTALAATNTPVFTAFTVPNRHVAVFGSFGHELTDASQWGTVIWTIEVSQRPARTYFDFRQQIGMFVEPTPLGSPLVVGPNKQVRVLARRGVAAVSALARLKGYIFSLDRYTQDGSFRDFLTK